MITASRMQLVGLRYFILFQTDIGTQIGRFIQKFLLSKEKPAKKRKSCTYFFFDKLVTGNSGVSGGTSSEACDGRLSGIKLFVTLQLVSMSFLL